MTKNLFSREYTVFLYALSTDRLKTRKLVFFFLFSLNFFKATALEVQPPAQNTAGVIYVSGNAKVVGTVDNAIVVLNDNNLSKTVKAAKEKGKQPASQLEIASVKKKESFKKIARKIDLEKKKMFYSSTTKSNLKDSYLTHLANFVVSITVNPSVKLFGTTVSEGASVVKYSSQLIKQKFETSLSYLQFEKYRSSSLRGPPYSQF